MTNNDALLPCPFCGTAAGWSKAHYVNDFTKPVSCLNLDCFASENDVHYTRWNTRHQPTPTDEAKEKPKCWRCNGDGEWLAGVDKCTPVKCDPCPAPERKYNERGWLITDKAPHDLSTSETAEARTLCPECGVPVNLSISNRCYNCSHIFNTDGARKEALDALDYLTKDGDYNDEGKAAIRTIHAALSAKTDP